MRLQLFPILALPGLALASAVPSPDEVKDFTIIEVRDPTPVEDSTLVERTRGG